MLSCTVLLNEGSNFAFLATMMRILHFFLQFIEIYVCFSFDEFVNPAEHKWIGRVKLILMKLLKLSLPPLPLDNLFILPEYQNKYCQNSDIRNIQTVRNTLSRSEQIRMTNSEK